MNNTQLQIKFKQRLNKLASNDYDNLECWQIVEAFNKAQIEWVRRQLHGTNAHKEGDEMSTKRIDDLQKLLTSQTLLAPINLGANSCMQYDLPENYLEFKRVTSYGKAECCNTPHTMQVYLSEEGNVNLLMRDPLKRPDFDWGETFCTMRSNTVRVYYREFDILTTNLTYYRNPINIQIQGCSDPITGGVSPQDVPCEFKDDVAEVILDDAVSIIAGDIQDVNNYMRGMQQAEKNN